MKSSTWNVLAASALFSLAAWVGVSSAAAGEPPQGDRTAKAGEQPASQDTLIFRNGRTMKGTIISETATSVRFKGETAGIAFETDFPKSDILEMKKAARAAEGAAPAAAASGGPVNDIHTPVKAVEPVDDGISRKKLYWMDLEGKFGQEISQTPIRKLVQDAKANRADVIVIMLNNLRVDPRAAAEQAKELPDDAGQFQGLSRAEKILPIFVDEMPVEWDGKDGRPAMPRIVMWIKRAMGGACFVPFFCKELYFDPEGKMGGIGNLSYMMKGHERVVNKQISLRIQHAAGWANVGGYP